MCTLALTIIVSLLAADRSLGSLQLGMPVLCEYAIAAYFAYFSKVRIRIFFPHSE